MLMNHIPRRDILKQGAYQTPNRAATSLDDLDLLSGVGNYHSEFVKKSFLFNNDVYITYPDDTALQFGTGGSTELPFTIFARIRPNVAQYFRIFAKGDLAVGNIDYFFRLNQDNKLQLSLHRNSSAQRISLVSVETFTAYEGKWINVMCTYSGLNKVNSDINLYAWDSNGVAIAFTTVGNDAGTYSTGMANNAVPVYIGTQNSADSQGNQKDTRVYPSVLTSDERSRVVKGEILGTEVFHDYMTEISGSTTTDSSSTGLTGTIVNNYGGFLAESVLSNWVAPNEVKRQVLPQPRRACKYSTNKTTIPASTDFDFNVAGQDQPFSIMALIYMVDATHFRIFNKGDLAAAEAVDINFGFQNTDKLVFNCYEGATSKRIGVITGTTFTSRQNTWVWVLGTYDGSEVNGGFNLKVWELDGTVISLSSVSESAGTYTGMENNAVGCHIGSFNGVYADGNIARLGVYDKVLTTQEEDDFRALKYIAPSNCKLYQKNDEGAGTLRFDSSGNNNHGVTSGTVSSIDVNDPLIPSSFQNDYGYTKSDGISYYRESSLTNLIPEGVLIPRLESDPTKCAAYVAGGVRGELMYKGQVRQLAKITTSPDGLNFQNYDAVDSDFPSDYEAGDALSTKMLVDRTSTEKKILLANEDISTNTRLKNYTKTA